MNKLVISLNKVIESFRKTKQCTVNKVKITKLKFVNFVKELPPVFRRIIRDSTFASTVDEAATHAEADLPGSDGEYSSTRKVSTSANLHPICENPCRALIIYKGQVVNSKIPDVPSCQREMSKGKNVSKASENTKEPPRKQCQFSKLRNCLNATECIEITSECREMVIEETQLVDNGPFCSCTEEPINPMISTTEALFKEMCLVHRQCHRSPSLEEDKRHISDGPVEHLRPYLYQFKAGRFTVELYKYADIIGL